MKKILYLFLAPLLFILINYPAYSQNNDINWEAGHVKFVIPNNLIIQKNDDTEFKAGLSDGSFLFQIFISMGCGGSCEELEKRDLLDDAAINGLYDYESSIKPINIWELTGFELSGKRTNSQLSTDYMTLWVVDHPQLTTRLHIYFISNINSLNYSSTVQTIMIMTLNPIKYW